MRLPTIHVEDAGVILGVLVQSDPGYFTVRIGLIKYDVLLEWETAEHRKAKAAIVQAAREQASA